jgi:hypothetical protein
VTITGLALIATAQVGQGICLISGPLYHLVSSLCGRYQVIDNFIKKLFRPTLAVLEFLYLPSSLMGVPYALSMGYKVLKKTQLFTQYQNQITDYLKEYFKPFKTPFGSNTVCHTEIKSANVDEFKILDQFIILPLEKLTINPQALCKYAYKDYDLPTLPFETLTQLFETLKEDQSLEHTLIDELKEDPKFLDELQHACPEASMQQIEDELTTFISLWQERTKKTVLSYFCERFEHFKTLINDQNPTAQEAKCQLQHLLVHIKQLKDSNHSMFTTSFIDLIKYGSINTLFLKRVVAINLSQSLKETAIYPLKLKILFEQCRYNLIKDEGLLPPALPQDIDESMFVGFFPITQAESEAIPLTEQIISFLKPQNFKSALLTKYLQECLSIVKSVDQTKSLQYAESFVDSLPIDSIKKKHYKELLESHPFFLNRFILWSLGVINAPC